MDDDCTECKIENIQLQSVPECTIKNIKKICTKIPECRTIKDIEYLLKENDAILYITIYLAICWILLQPFRK